MNRLHWGLLGYYSLSTLYMLFGNLVEKPQHRSNIQQYDAEC